MNFSVIKRLASSLLKVGKKRIKIRDSSNFNQIMTRQDVREAVDSKAIEVVSEKHPRKKKRSNRKGIGRRKGKKYSKIPAKELWMRRIRSQRKLLNELISSGKLDKAHKREIYLKIKGGSFKGKRALLNYLKENKLLKE